MKWMASGNPVEKPLDSQWVGDFIAAQLGRVADLLVRAKTLTKLVEVDRTRAHYGTTKWESWQLPKFLYVMDFPGKLFPEAVKREFGALWLWRPVDSLSQEQIRVLMRMIEVVYRDTFVNLASDLRGVERDLESLRDSGDFENLPDILHSLGILEDMMDSLSLSTDLTIRKADTTKFRFVRGGVWLRRWRSWSKTKRS